jgi:hypothetical protein
LTKATTRVASPTTKRIYKSSGFFGEWSDCTRLNRDHVGDLIKRLEKNQLLKVKWHSKGFVIQEISKSYRKGGYELVADQSRTLCPPDMKWQESLWADTIKTIIEEDPADKCLQDRFPEMAFLMLRRLMVEQGKSQRWFAALARRTRQQHQKQLAAISLERRQECSASCYNLVLWKLKNQIENKTEKVYYNKQDIFELDQETKHQEDEWDRQFEAKNKDRWRQQQIEMAQQTNKESDKEITKLMELFKNLE